MNSNLMRRRILIISILLLAFCLRLAYLAEIRAISPADELYCGPDRVSYNAHAIAALAGDWPGQEPFRMIPLYSFYVFFVYKIFGINYLAPLIIQILFDVMACAALFQIGKLAFSELTGLLAALAVAIYGPLILYQVCYAQELLTTPLLVLMFYFLLKFDQLNKLPYLLISGVALGACALSRPTMLILTPVVLLWLLWTKGVSQKLIQQSGLFLAVVSLTIAPVTFHNYLVTGRIIPIADVITSENLYLGNNPDASGTGQADFISYIYGNQVKINGISISDEFEAVWARVKRNETTFLKEAVNYMAEHPEDLLELTARKVYLMFLEPDWKLLEDVFAYPSSSAALKGTTILQLLPIEWAVLVFMGVFSICFVRNRYTFLFLLTILAISLITIPFFIHFRFRLPLAPFLLLLMAGLITSSRAWGDQGRRKFGLILLILLVPFVPGLLIILIPYAVISLFPIQNVSPVWPSRWPLAAGWSYVVITLFGLQMLAVSQANAQTKDYYYGPEIWGPTIVGQTFSPDCDGLYQIEVTLSRLSFRHDQPYYFHLVKDLNLSDEIYSTRFEVTDVSKWTRKKFTFPAQVNSRQQTYFFYLQSPTSHPGNSITVRLNADLPTIYRRYQPGSIYAGSMDNLQAFPGDLAFTAYCRENLVQLLARTMQHLATSGPAILAYTTIYYSILFLHLLLLALSVVKMSLRVRLNRNFLSLDHKPG